MSDALLKRYRLPFFALGITLAILEVSGCKPWPNRDEFSDLWPLLLVLVCCLIVVFNGISAFPTRSTTSESESPEMLPHPLIRAVVLIGTVVTMCGLFALLVHHHSLVILLALVVAPWFAMFILDWTRDIRVDRKPSENATGQ